MADATMTHEKGKLYQLDLAQVQSVPKQPRKFLDPKAIRDECRTSNTTSRRALVEVARKKQERSMITAWNAYKAKLAKQVAGGTKQAKVPLSPEDVIAWLGKTADKLDGIDTGHPEPGGAKQFDVTFRCQKGQKK